MSDYSYLNIASMILYAYISASDFDVALLKITANTALTLIDNGYCLISLTLPVDLCLYMGFLIAWRIVCSRASPGEL